MHFIARQLRNQHVSLALAAVGLLSSPAAAELKVAVSKAVTGRFESVGVTVSDPLGGLDTNGAVPTVTIADSSDHQHHVPVRAAGRPGEWTGRFTPLRVGRYTGTAVLERAGSKEIGLVPLVRVQASRKPGFLRLHPTSKRVFKWSEGGSFFPVGVRIEPADLQRVTDWREEVARLEFHGVNYVEVSAPWPASQSDGESDAAAGAIDTLLIEAEQRNGFAVQVRVALPEEALADGGAAAEEQVKRWVERWSYSPALGAWRIGGADEDLAAGLCARLVQAVRAADPSGRIIAARSGDGAVTGADLEIAAAPWQRPLNRFALFEVIDQRDDPKPLPGETSWQMLVFGGVGLPLYRYRPGSEAGAALLSRLSRMAQAAKAMPFHAAPAPLTGVAPVDMPASFCRYGPAWSGWISPDTDRVLTLPDVPRGRYKALFWNPATDQPAGEKLVWSDGKAGVRLELPPQVPSVYLQVHPAAQPAAKTSARKTTRRAPRRRRR
jgi:hypothetical protein